MRVGKFGSSPMFQLMLPEQSRRKMNSPVAFRAGFDGGRLGYSVSRSAGSPIREPVFCTEKGHSVVSSTPRFVHNWIVNDTNNETFFYGGLRGAANGFGVPFTPGGLPHGRFNLLSITDGKTAI